MQRITTEASNKARKLFVSFLTKEQEETLELFETIRIIGNVTKNYYYLYANCSSYNIFTSFACYCVTLGKECAPVPIFDFFLIEKLFVENWEDRFMMIANPLAMNDLYSLEKTKRQKTIHDLDNFYKKRSPKVRT